MQKFGQISILVISLRRWLHNWLEGERQIRAPWWSKKSLET